MKLFVVALLLTQLNHSSKNTFMPDRSTYPRYPVCLQSFQEIQAITCYHKFRSDFPALNKWICEQNSSCPKCTVEISSVSTASLQENSEEIDTLLAEGADVKRVDEFLYGWNALYFTIADDRISIVTILRNKGRKVHTAESAGTKNALHLAAHEGRESIVKMLLAMKPENINAQDKYGQTPLMLACLNGHGSLVKFLLENGANANVADHKYGITALHWAAREGYESIVKSLLAKNANVNAQDRYGESPIMIATAKGYASIVKILLEKGAQILKLQKIKNVCCCFRTSELDLIHNNQNKK